MNEIKIIIIIVNGIFLLFNLIMLIKMYYIYHKHDSSQNVNSDFSDIEEQIIILETQVNDLRIRMIETEANAKTAYEFLKYIHEGKK